MQKKAYKEMLRDTAKDKCTAASNASSKFSSEEYRHSCRTKRRGVSRSPTLWWASCCLMCWGSICSFDTKSASRIPRELFDIESPNFTRHTYIYIYIYIFISIRLQKAVHFSPTANTNKYRQSDCLPAPFDINYSSVVLGKPSLC